MSKLRCRWLGGFGCAVALVVTDAGAQQRQIRATVGASLSLGSIWGNENRLSWSPIVGIAVRYQPWERWGFEFDTRHYTYKRRFPTSGVVFAGEGVAFTGGVTYYLRTSGPRPFVSGGIGILRSERESRFPIHAPLSSLRSPRGAPPIIGEALFRSTGTDAGLSVGGGVDVPLGSHWSLRPEARALFGAGSVLSPLGLGGSLAFGW